MMVSLSRWVLPETRTPGLGLVRGRRWRRPCSFPLPGPGLRFRLAGLGSRPCTPAPSGILLSGLASVPLGLCSLEQRAVQDRCGSPVQDMSRNKRGYLQDLLTRATAAFQGAAKTGVLVACVLVFVQALCTNVTGPRHTHEQG